MVLNTSGESQNCLHFNGQNPVLTPCTHVHSVCVHAYIRTHKHTEMHTVVNVLSNMQMERVEGYLPICAAWPLRARLRCLTASLMRSTSIWYLSTHNHRHMNKQHVKSISN